MASAVENERQQVLDAYKAKILEHQQMERQYVRTPLYLFLFSSYLNVLHS